MRQSDRSGRPPGFPVCEVFLAKVLTATHVRDIVSNMNPGQAHRKTRNKINITPTLPRSPQMNIPTQITDNVDLASKTIVDVNDRVLDTVVTVNRRIVDTVVEVADRVPAARVEVPFADRLPTVADAGKRYIDFVERAASVNRDFTARVVANLPKSAAVAPKAKAARPAKKSAKAAK